VGKLSATSSKTDLDVGVGDLCTSRVEELAKAMVAGEQDCERVHAAWAQSTGHEARRQRLERLEEWADFHARMRDALRRISDDHDDKLAWIIGELARLEWEPHTNGDGGP
jgi:hypothetical protein